jgi:hypothetical protein
VANDPSPGGSRRMTNGTNSGSLMAWFLVKLTLPSTTTFSSPVPVASISTCAPPGQFTGSTSGSNLYLSTLVWGMYRSGCESCVMRSWYSVPSNVDSLAMSHSWYLREQRERKHG